MQERSISEFEKHWAGFLLFLVSLIFFNQQTAQYLTQRQECFSWKTRSRNLAIYQQLSTLNEYLFTYAHVRGLVYVVIVYSSTDDVR